jgi:hypothetical protein
MKECLIGRIRRFWKPEIEESNPMQAFAYSVWYDLPLDATNVRRRKTRRNKFVCYIETL